MERGKTTLARWVLLGVVVVAIGGVVIRYGHIESLTQRSIEFLRTAGPLPFFTAMALLPLLGFPLSPFTLAAGPVFGPTLGVGNVIACAIGAVTINVALAYWIADRALRPPVTRLTNWLGCSLPVLPPDFTSDITLLVRIIPGPPFFLQSYLLGLARVPFRTYMTVSTLVPATYIVGAIIAGDALMRGDRRSLAVAGVLSVAAAVAMYRLRRRFRSMRAAG